MQGFEFFCPTKIVCGAHALDKLPGELDVTRRHPSAGHDRRRAW